MNENAFDRSDKRSYFQYLQKRSLLGVLYRKGMLYPKLSSFLEGHVLDYGCGIGDFIKYRSNTVGADINDHNIEYCQSLGLDAQLIKDGSIPFSDARFDAIVMDNVLEHIPAKEVEGALHELMRVLRPGGRLLIGVPGVKGYASDPDHKCFYSESDLIALVEPLGFHKVKSFHMPIHFQWLEKYISQYCIYVVFDKIS